MKVLEEARTTLQRDLPYCKSHNDLEKLLMHARDQLAESKAPHGQKIQMWEQLKQNLSNLIRRPDLVNDAHAIIDGILKNTYTPVEL
ncbi:MAG TPA: hypothetical protein VGM92_00815 [Candidatus Kapabacteria bacterium]|jgi:hypothetical protein